MTREEIDTAIQWAADEGWNPGIFDADPFRATDPEGFLIGLLGDEKIAMISAVAYGENFGFIGFFLVKPEYRRQGYGLQIWQAAMARLAGRNIGLDGVLAQQDNYRKSGFALAHRNIRYRGSGGGIMPPMEQCASIVSMPYLSLKEVCAYDCGFFPESRRVFLQKWLSIPYSTVLGIREGGKLAGFGVLRPCREGFKIGPLFADTPEHAETLFMAMRAQTQEHEPVFLDVPETNPAAVELAQRHGMTPVFETARMYTQAIPDLSPLRTFGITTFELG
ncbi:MAG: GNAT family N-acetyltransferase [Burkholderiaceae bacterium]|nr:GNAT family N-acetyltransferase [Burkholderiaceae bacterium]